MLDFRSDQIRLDREPRQNKVILLDRAEFPQMPLLPPSTPYKYDREPGQRTSSVSSDQMRVKMERQRQQFERKQENESCDSQADRPLAEKHPTTVAEMELAEKTT